MIAGRDVLLDSGPLVGLLDRRDQWHDRVPDTWRAVAARCITTEAVVVEATHIVGKRTGDYARVLELLVATDIAVFALHRPLHEACIHLMHRYAAVPMDYADATLVALADRLRIRQVFTFDRRGFRQYQGATSRAPLSIIPTP